MYKDIEKVDIKGNKERSKMERDYKYEYINIIKLDKN